MITAEINYWAVLVSGVASMIMSYAWYSMPAFGRIWATLIGKTEAQLKAGYKPTTFAKTFGIALVMIYILAHFIDYAGATTVGQGAITGFWLWLGFVATTTLATTIYEGRPGKLWLINTGYQLLNLIVAGAILAVWA